MRARSMYRVFMVSVSLLCVCHAVWADTDVGHIAVLETDPTMLQPGELFDLNGQTLTFTPKPDGGYTVSRGTLSFDTALGTNLGLGDDTSAALALGFAFPFFGASYTSVFVNANGNLTFGASSSLSHFNSGGSVTALGNAASVLDRIASGLPRIAVLWQNWNPAAGGGVFAKLQPDRLTVTWSAVPLSGTTTTGTFQVVLVNSGVVQMSYQDVSTTPGGGYLTGISPGAQSEFLVTTVDFSQNTGASISDFPNQEPLVQVFGSAASPLLHVPAVARRFLVSHNDDVDQLVIFANFTHAMGNAFAFEVTFRQTVAGIGLGLYDASSFLGSTGRMQSVLNMNRLSLYPDDPTAQVLGTNSTLDIMGHEAGHQWLAFVTFDDGGLCSDLLLGRDLAHWSFFHNTDASAVEGNKWQDHGNGTFTTIEATARYSALDQYLMGLRAASTVPTFFFIDAPTGTTRTRSSAPAIGVTVGGTRQNVSVHQVIACEGARTPSSGFTGVNLSQTWRQAFVLVVKSGTTPTLTELTKIDTIRDAWGAYFTAATSGLGQVDTTLTATLPDLVVSSLSNPPSLAAIGTGFQVTTTVHNQGTAPAGASSTRYYLSLDTAKSSGDKLLTGTLAVPGLIAGGVSTGTVTVTIPTSTVQGAYYLLACADDTNAVVESSQVNNCRASGATVHVGAPDLLVLTVSAPPGTAVLGGSFIVTDTVHNQGTAPAGASTVRYYLSLDTLKQSTDIRLTGSRAVSGLAAGSEASGSATVTIPTTTALGTYYLLACADDTQVVSESNESNNCRAAGTTVHVQAPELVVTAVSNPPAAAARGSSFGITNTVRNQGTAAAGPSTTRYYLSLDTLKQSTDIRLTGTSAVPDLAAGSEASGSATVTIPTTTALGTYYLLACADDTQVVSESNESNNCRAAGTTVHVQAPELVVTAVSNPPAAAARGSSFGITNTVRNQGTAAAGPSTTRYYLSLDTLKQSTDIRLTGTSAVPGLAAGSEASGSATVTVPTTTALGTYYLLACADDTQVVSESNESNNCQAAGTTVAVGP